MTDISARHMYINIKVILKIYTNISIHFENMFIGKVLSCLRSSMICSQFHSQSHSNVNIHGDTNKYRKSRATLMVHKTERVWM